MIDAPAMTPRATKFMAAMRAIEDAYRLVGELEVGLFGFQFREVVEAKLFIRKAEERLISVANLGRETDS